MVKKIVVIFLPTIFNESQQLSGREQHRMQRSLGVSGRRRDKVTQGWV